MKKFTIMADATCDLGEDLGKEYHIEVVPTHIMLPDGRADVEVLSCSGEVGPEFEPLRETIRKISPRFFVRYWMVDGQSLPGCYLKGILYEDGTWRFYMDKFLMQARWRVW